MTSAIQDLLNQERLPFAIEMDDGVQHVVVHWWQVAANAEHAYYLPIDGGSGIFLSTLHMRRIIPASEQSNGEN